MSAVAPAILAARDDVREGRLDDAVRRLEPFAVATPTDRRRILLDQLRATRTLRDDLGFIYRVGGAAAAKVSVDRVAALAGMADEPLVSAYVASLGRSVSQLDAAAADVADAVAKSDRSRARRDIAVISKSTYATEDQLKLADEYRRRIDEEESVWSPLLQSFRELPVALGLLLKLLIYFVLAFMLYALWRQLPRFNDRHEFTLYRADKGDKDGNTFDAALSAQLLGELRQIALGPKRQLVFGRQARLGDMVGSEWATEVRSDLESLGSRIDASQQVAIGVFKISLQSIWSFLTGLLVPRARFQWSGVLLRIDGETRLTLARHDRMRWGDGMAPAYVAVRADTEERAQTEAIQRMAYRVVFDELKEPPTSSSEAFYAFHRAMALLNDSPEAPEMRANLLSAKLLLQLAVQTDPRFFRARWQLGIVLRKLKEIELARAVFEDLLLEPPDEITRLELRFHRAVVDARAPFLDSIRNAAAGIREVCHAAEERLKSSVASAPNDRRSPNANVKPLARDERERVVRLSLFATSLQSEIAALLLTPWTFVMRITADEEQQVRSDHAHAVRFFQQPCPEGTDPQAHNLARAHSLIADGQLAAADVLQGRDANRARRCFAQALACCPQLVDGYSGLSRVYRWKKEANWLQLARRALNAGRAIDGQDIDLLSEYVTVLRAAEIPLNDEARQILELKVDGDLVADQRADACFNYGDILCSTPATAVEGLRRLRKSSRMYSRAGYPPANFDLQVIRTAKRCWKAFSEEDRKQARALADDALASLRKQRKELFDLLESLDPSAGKRTALAKQKCKEFDDAVKKGEKLLAERWDERVAVAAAPRDGQAAGFADTAAVGAPIAPVDKSIETGDVAMAAVAPSEEVHAIPGLTEGSEDADEIARPNEEAEEVEAE